MPTDYPNAERFAKLVKDLAAGKRPAAADVEDVLLKSGKTQGDLEDAVAARVRENRWTPPLPLQS